MRMVDTVHPQLSTTAAYRVVNDHNPNVVVEKLPLEKVGTDDDDDDTELLGDGDIESRLGLCRTNDGDVANSPHSRMEHDKRLRREIANSNERRRMQSINAGFQSLKALLPRRDGEKMSKASILQQTADFIRSLQSEKDILLQQSSEMKQMLDIGVLKSGRQMVEKVLTPSCIPKIETLPLEKRRYLEYGITTMDISTAPPKKRRKFENDSADEGLGMMSDAEAITIPRMSPEENRKTAVPTSAAITQTDPPRATVEASCCTSPIPPQQMGESKTLESSMVQDKLWEIEMLQRQLIELRLALDRERRARLMLEEQMRMLELNRLQTLARLQTVPLLEYNVPQTPAATTLVYPSAVSSPVAVFKPSSPALLRSLSPTLANNPAVISHGAATVPMSTTPMMTGVSATTFDQSAPPTSFHSLPDPVSSRIVPMAPSQATSIPAASSCDSLSLPTVAASVVSVAHRPSASSSLSPPPVSAISKQTGQPNSSNANNPSLYPSSSSKQSLAAIVEAIRHLEGDQLFVDVELQRPMAQQQSMMVSAVVSTTTGAPAIVASHCQSSAIGAVPLRPDYTDSGISSPVSERHLLGNFAPNGGQSAGSVLVPVANESNVGCEMNHVVAATAAALHNLCFPYTNSQHLSTAASVSRHVQHQGRHRAAGWTSASLQ